MISLDYTILQNHFVDAWTSTVPVFYDAAPNADRPINAPYVHFSVRAGASVHAMGSAQAGEMRQLGRVWLQIFIPSGQGDAIALQLIDDFATIFRHWESDDGAIRCATEEIGAPMPDRDTDMLMYTVSIPWDSYRSY